ncbi:MAG: hypothetical protein LBU34_08720 [Planctomycetaceae bacterium]|jgi:hypothetical protein|nr:hypothetical protein [Planctomycetaceae bacterium]
MNTYIISYDLINPGQNYENLLKKIRSFSSWARLGGSAYIVETEETASQVRDKLTSFLDNNDKLFVGTVQAPAAWIDLGDEVSQWISSHLR